MSRDSNKDTSTISPSVDPHGSGARTSGVAGMGVQHNIAGSKAKPKSTHAFVHQRASFAAERAKSSPTIVPRDSLAHQSKKLQEAQLSPRRIDYGLLVALIAAVVALGVVAVQDTHRFTLELEAADDEFFAAAAAAFSTSLAHLLADIEAQHTATTSLLSAHQSLATFQAIQPLSPTYTTEWAPRVLHADVAQFESDAVAQVGSPTWGLSTASISTTGTYTDYFPVLYAHPPSLARFLVDTRPSLASNATTTSSTASTTSLSTVTRHSTTDAILGVTTTTINWATLITTSLHITITSPTSTLFTSATTSPTTTTSTTTIPFGSDQLTLTIARTESSYSQDTINPIVLYVLFGTVVTLLVVLLCRSAVLYGLLRSAEQVERGRSQQTKGFMAFLTHELRNPLFAVLGITGELREMLEKRNSKRLLSVVNSIDLACDRMTSIINDVLAMRKLEEGKLKLEMSEFSPRDVMREVHSMFRKRAERKSITVDLLLPRTTPFRAIGDSARLVQVLSNLMSNAIKFTPEGGAMELLLDRVDADGPRGSSDVLRFSVTDTGCGISPEGIDRIFEPYVQASADVERKHGGTGLGLSIVQMMCQAMGGQISVISEVGEGSTFFCDIPLEVVRWERGTSPVSRLRQELSGSCSGSLSACSAVMERSSNTARHGELPGTVAVREMMAHDDSAMSVMSGFAGSMVAPEPDLRLLDPLSQPLCVDLPILVVDDVSINTRILKRIITQAFPNVHVDTAENGVQALEAVRATEYGMIFMDVTMPVMGGRKAAAAMRTAGCDVAIVAVTGSDDSDAYLLNAQSGYTETALKPLKKSKVIALVRKYLRRARRDTYASVPGMWTPSMSPLPHGDSQGFNKAESTTTLASMASSNASVPSLAHPFHASSLWARRSSVQD